MFDDAKIGHPDGQVGEVRTEILNSSLRQRPSMFGRMLGESAALRDALELAQKAARSEANIFLCGESGTGKELAAKAIHDASARAARVFIAVDCASLPENLLEAELFGYEKGAFTGAIRSKLGLMESADGGTLFLDEVGEIPIALQCKLLRAIQEKEHRRVGGMETIKFDIRVISATSRDLHQQVKERKFRGDLLFRLNVIPIRLPALRERNGDVRMLAEYFLREYSEIDTATKKSFAPDVLGVFETYRWPGNIRELQNVVRRMCILAPATIIEMRDVPVELMRDEESATLPIPLATPETSGMTFREAKRRYLSRFEDAYLRGVLDRYEGNVSRAADAAEVDRKTFYRLMTKHGLRAAFYRDSAIWNQR